MEGGYRGLGLGLDGKPGLPTSLRALCMVKLDFTHLCRKCADTGQLSQRLIPLAGGSIVLIDIVPPFRPLRTTPLLARQSNLLPPC